MTHKNSSDDIGTFNNNQNENTLETNNSNNTNIDILYR